MRVIDNRLEKGDDQTNREEKKRVERKEAERWGFEQEEKREGGALLWGLEVGMERRRDVVCCVGWMSVCKGRAWQ